VQLTLLPEIRATAATLATWGVISWLSAVNKRWRLERLVHLVVVTMQEASAACRYQVSSW